MNIDSEFWNLPYNGNILSGEYIEDARVKLYFIDILGEGRTPENYQWAHSGLSQDKLVQGLKKQVISSKEYGLLHLAVSFPHVTALYRFGATNTEKERETNWHRVGLGRTPQLENITFPEPGYPYEIGCPGEIYIVGAENEIRNTSRTKEDLLERFAPNGQHEAMNVLNPNLLKELGFRRLNG